MPQTTNPAWVFFKLSAVLLASSVLVTCKSRETMSDPVADDAARQVLGMDHPYGATPLSPAEVEELESSVAKRRLLGWQIAQRVFEPVSLPGNSSMAGAERMALWQTWFTSAEIEKMFEILYRAIPPKQRVTESFGDPVKPVPSETIDCVLKRYASPERLKRRHGAMYDSRILKKVAQLREGPARSVNGVAKGVTLFNLAVARHYLANYAKVLQCTGGMAENYEGDLGSNFAPCFFEEFPSDAVAVKAVWARDDEPIPVYDTSAAGLAEMLEGKRLWEPRCDAPPCLIAKDDPRLDRDMFATRMTHPNGESNSFRLVGLHVATKESRDWTWTTLWWSPKPREDFGADQPEWFGVYGGQTVGAMKNYKMCNATSYREKDDVLLGKVSGFTARPGDRSLEGAMLASLVHGQVRPDGAPRDVFNTWCSNPYIERDPGMSDTNCIGCHQKAEPQGVMKTIRHRDQQIFPSDYAWSLEFYMDIIGKENDNFKSKLARVAERDLEAEFEECVTP